MIKRQSKVAYHSHGLSFYMTGLGRMKATAVKLEDGRWCLFLDYYGVPGAGQGYVPFVADSLESGRFVRADERFSFPYGYKHGTILTITLEQYKALSEWEEKE